MSRKKTTEDFISAAHKVHGDRYDYSKVVYESSDTKVCIICSKHGPFWQTPMNHLSGHGCRFCSQEEIGKINSIKRRGNIPYNKINTEQFVSKAQIIHGDDFLFGRTKYITARDHIIVECAKCGSIVSCYPSDFLQQEYCCPVCKKAHNTEVARSKAEALFLQKAHEVHKGKYDYSSVNYVNSHTKVAIICPEHGKFYQDPSKHLMGQGCPICAKPGLGISTDDFFIKAQSIFKNKYDYSEVSYQGANIPVKIICHNIDISGKEHGIFYKKPIDHLNGEGCPKCGKKCYDLDTFLASAKSVHGDTYDYSSSVYKGIDTPITIICKIHGAFYQTPYSHLRGSGCPKCSQHYKPSTGEFILASQKIHGNKYDYSQVNYLNSQSPVMLICPEHGEFEITPTAHLKGMGCPLCTKNRRLTTPQFISKVKSQFGDIYDCSCVEYHGVHEKVCLICHQRDSEGYEHGPFWVAPDNLFKKKIACPKCSDDELGINRIHSTQDFIERATEVHGLIYDYSKSVYQSMNSPVEIICPIHGAFLQSPAKHLVGNGMPQGCPICGRNKISIVKTETKESFLAKYHRKYPDAEYDFSKAKYVKWDVKIAVECHNIDSNGNEHGVFYITPNSLLNGHGCRKCMVERAQERLTMTFEEFCNRARLMHGERYDYSKVSYQTANIPVSIICPDHGLFMQTPSAHLHGRGCPKCSSSRLEEDIRLFLSRTNIIFEEQKKFEWLVHKGNLRLDFYLPEYNVAIECQGGQHFEPIEYFGGEEEFKDNQEKDCIKRDLCQSHGISLYYYSNLGIDYPYQVFEDKEDLLRAIISEANS